MTCRTPWTLRGKSHALHHRGFPPPQGGGCLAGANGRSGGYTGPRRLRQGAQYQVEISANNVGGVPGDGVWLWIELNSNGTGDYTGGDCIHTGPTGLNGAAHERGDVTWTDSGGKLTISGVGLVGGQYPVTVVVPDRYGHYTGASGNFVQYPRPDRPHRPSASRPVPSRTHSGHWKPTVASRMQSGQT